MAEVQASQDKSARRLLLIVAIVAGAMIVAAMAIAGWRARKAMFSPEVWAKGRNQFRADNPRLPMADQVIARIDHSYPSEKQVRNMLGAPDPDFEIHAAGRLPQQSSNGAGELKYVLGVKAKTMFQERSIQVLDVYTPTKGSGAEYAFVEGIDYPQGAVIAPLTPRKHMPSIKGGPGFVPPVGPKALSPSKASLSPKPRSIPAAKHNR